MTANKYYKLFVLQCIFFIIILFITIHYAYAEIVKFSHIELNLKPGWKATQEKGEPVIKAIPEDGADELLHIIYSYISEGNTLKKEMERIAQEDGKFDVQKMEHRDGVYWLTRDTSNGKRISVSGTQLKNNMVMFCFIRAGSWDPYTIAQSANMHTYPPKPEPRRERRDVKRDSQGDLYCYNINMWDDPGALNMCLGDCYYQQNSKIRDVCLGNCSQAPNDSLKMACYGNCALLKDDKAKAECYRCGGGPRWTALYLAGYVLRCN